jgi:ATP synthase protein I
MQLLVAVVLALGLLIVGPVAAYSSFSGSMAVFFPGLVFSLLVVRKLGGSSASFLGAVALAEAGKLFLTGLFCAAAFVWIKPLAAGWFFTGMMVVLASSWIGMAKAIR